METSVNNKCKAFTSLEQSKKLAEILPLESADMYCEWPNKKAHFKDNNYNGMGISCWSLAALLDVLPEYNLQRTDWGNKTEYKIVVTINEDNYASKNYNNPVDACYEMIIKLNELEML